MFRPIIIELRLKYEQHSADLAKRLSVLGHGMEFRILPERPEEAETHDDTDVTVLTIDDEMAWTYPSASELYGALKDEYELRTGVPFPECVRGDAHILVLCSETGGAGKTSIGITLARILSGRFGRRVLFIGDGRGDTARYLNTAGGKNISEREMSYRIRNYLIGDGSRFLVSDFYGPDCVECREPFLFLTRRERGEAYDYIIIDLPAGEMPEMSEEISFRSLRIMNDRDLRSRNSKPGPEGEIAVCNMCAFPYIKEDSIQIEWEPDAFSLKEGRIDIRMDSLYAMSIHRLAERIEEEEYGNL